MKNCDAGRNEGNTWEFCFFRRGQGFAAALFSGKRQQPAFAGLPAFTIGNGVGTLAIAKSVGALDTGKLNRALKGDIEAPKTWRFRSSVCLLIRWWKRGQGCRA
jgi:hypothetical protein